MNVEEEISELTRFKFFHLSVELHKNYLPLPLEPLLFEFPQFCDNCEFFSNPFFGFGS